MQLIDEVTLCADTNEPSTGSFRVPSSAVGSGLRRTYRLRSSSRPCSITGQVERQWGVTRGTLSVNGVMGRLEWMGMETGDPSAKRE
jgi:hypothetical protein